MNNYAYSAIFGPSDTVCLPLSLIAENDPNRNMVTSAELDLNSLADLCKKASVHPLDDHNLDAYEWLSHLPIEIIQTG